MKKTNLSAALLSIAIAFGVVPGSQAGRGALAGDYQRVILVSWDGVRRDVLFDLLERTDPNQPCWSGGAVFPVATGRVNGQGAATYTCLPALSGLKPAGMPDDSPAYGPFQVIASHTTNDGATMTKPQHGAMLTGYDTTGTGITSNVSTVRMPEGLTIYERLMDQFDPPGGNGLRNGYLFRTQHSADKKFVGSSIVYWAKKSRALQLLTGHGSEEGTALGSLKYANASFPRWKAEAAQRGLGLPSFFMFLHFKNTDWTGHIAGDGSRYYREVIIATDLRLYLLLESLRKNGLDDTAVIVTTDHGFAGIQHARNGGRSVFNTWMAARNVHLDTTGVPLRTATDYCNSHENPADCLANGPSVPMPPEDVVPNVFVTDVVPTILDMFGVEWRTTSEITGRSLYRP